MCLLIYAQPNSAPTKKSLRRAAVQNPDGFGFAINNGKQVLYGKGMDIEDTIKEFFAVRERFPDSHALFHLRITTHGATNLDNCHPFVVDDGIVLAHNGMLPIKEENGKSDTRQFAEEWLPTMGVKEMLDTPEGFTDLEKFATGSKLAILSSNPLLDQPYYIVNEHLGHWKDGVWYSNNSYTKNYGKYLYSNWSRPATSTYEYNGHSYAPQDDSLMGHEWVYDEEMNEWYFQDDDDLVVWTCNFCDSNIQYDLQSEDPHYCPECGTCWFCDKPFDQCWCSGITNK